MNIVRENIGNLNEYITLKLETADYQDAVEKSLKDLRRRANIPGFRVGHVPMGMIERQYKPSVMMDEISKLINENLEKYLRENNINILFEPMAVPEKTAGEFEKGGDFSFTFEIGIRPEVKLDYAKAKDVPYLKISASESQIDDEVAKLRRRLGKFSSTEEIVDGDMALVTVTTGEEGKEPLSSSIPTTYFKDAYKKEFIGKKLHETMEIDTKEMFVSDYERATLLKVKPTELDNAPVKVNVLIDAIHHVEPAVVDADFFAQAFPDADVKDEAGMRARLKEQIERNYESQEKLQYRGKAMEALTAGMNFELPDAFVKRYLIDRDPANYTAESIEERYPDIQKSLCFQLVENTIAADGNINVTREDVLSYLQNYIAFNYFGQTYENLSEEQKHSMNSLTESMLQQEKTVSNVYENIYFERVTDVIFEKSAATKKMVSWEEFLSSSNSEAEAPKTKKTRAKKADVSEEAAEESATEIEDKPKKATRKAAKDKE